MSEHEVHPARQSASIELSSLRFHEMDALRALAMFLGVVYHALFSFTVPGPAFPGQDVSAGRWANIALAIPHGFRVELFYLIGGFFAHLVMTRYGVKGFLRNRGGRIFLPFVFAAALLVLVVKGLWRYGVWLGLHLWTPTWAPHPFYLWFLFYMVMMDSVCLLLVLARVDTLARPLLVVVDRLFARLVQSPLAPLVLALPSAVIRAFHPRAPYFDYVPVPLWLAYFGQFFAFGWWLHRQPALRFAIPRYRLLHLGLAAAAFLLWEVGGGRLPQGAVEYLQAVYSWLLVFALLGVFVAHFTQPSPIARYLADASYWTYLAHWPLLTFLQITLAQAAVPALVKLGCILFLVMAFCLVTYRYAVRYTWVGRVLNGPREPPRQPMEGRSPVSRLEFPS